MATVSQKIEWSVPSVGNEGLRLCFPVKNVVNAISIVEYVSSAKDMSVPILR